jgi:C-terminal processing protease CtpA/Prc
MASGKRFRLGNRFPFLFAHCFGFKKKFPVTYRAAGESAVREAVLESVGWGQIRNYREPVKRKETASDAGPLRFRILNDKNTALMTINTFGFYRERDKFYSFIDEAFVDIHENHIENLILDLRGNSGGDPFCTTHLLSYLQYEPVRYFARVYPEYEKFAEPIPLAENPFKGKLFVLIDGGCFSSTGHFCALLRSHDIGTFVGSETGATYTCNDATARMTLKKTNLRLFVARMTFEAAAGGLPRNRGILPDIPVEPQIKDMLARNDTVLEYTLEYIKENSPK